MIKAVIEIGSTGIRLMVAESAENKKNKTYNILDRSELPVTLGREVYTTGSISRDTILAVIRILQQYVEQLSGWQISPKDTIVIATSAVREAKNRDPFVDQIKVKTGFTVRVTDGIEENRYMYLALYECLKTQKANLQNSDSLIIDIAGGATDLMLMEKGRIVGAHSIRLGTVIIEQKISNTLGVVSDIQKFILEYVRNASKFLNNELNLKKLTNFIVPGNDMKLASRYIGNKTTEYTCEIDREDFIAFASEVKNYSLEQCIAKFNLSFADAQTFQIAIVAYEMFLNITSVKKIIVPDTSIREGVFLSLNDSKESSFLDELTQQITASAETLLRKYQGDELHAEYVRNASLEIFDALEKESGLDKNCRVLLEVSAILHDIGMFIGASNHHKHGRYIISNSEIFGISRDDKSLVAMIVNFHRGKKMPQDNDEFRLLPRQSRMTVLKLAAILRVADALDRTHTQHLKKFAIHFGKDTMTIHIKGSHSVSMEKLALAEKGVMFEEVFGYKIVLI